MAKKQETYLASIKFNPQEAYMIDQLLETGLYGYRRAEVVHRLVD